MESGWRSQCFLGRSVKTPLQLRQFREGGGDFLAKSAFAAEFGNFRHFGVDNFFRKKGRTLSINSAPISFRGFATRCPSPAQMTTKSWPDTQPGKVNFAWKWGHGGTTPESEGETLLNFGHDHRLPPQIPPAPMDPGERTQCFQGCIVETPVQQGRRQGGGGDFRAKSAFGADFYFFLDFATI